MNLKEMSFEELLEREFNEKFKLSSPNIKGDHPWILEHLHADFIELKALFWESGEWLSLIDVIGHYKDNDEKREESQNPTDEVGSNCGDIEDELLSKFIGFFKIIEERKQSFDKDYPFEIDKNKQLIRLPEESLTEKQILYLKLLLASNLNNFSLVGSYLSKDFEKVCAIALKEYLPNSIVKEFGKNTEYKGNTIKKINALSKELNLIKRENEIHKLSKNAAQEKGLDLIAYLPFTDQIASMVIILAQCACGKDWVKKTNETSNYLTFLDFYKLNPIHSMFVPYSLFIDNENGFYQSEKLTNRLVFERKRIIDSISDLTFITKLNSYKIVKKSIEMKVIEV